MCVCLCVYGLWRVFVSTISPQEKMIAVAPPAVVKHVSFKG